jgi:hypothetical protein
MVTCNLLKVALIIVQRVRLASRSATSFPVMPTYDGTHTNVTNRPLFYILSSSAEDMIIVPCLHWLGGKSEADLLMIQNKALKMVLRKPWWFGTNDPHDVASPFRSLIEP